MPAMKPETEIKNVFNGLVCRLAQLRKELVNPRGRAEPIASQQQSDRREWKGL